ncbi:hypothetical protein [uncultured Psychrobacter sp.]|uniref:hypothetical protein n=1 Tax=uncultured Psychrobacter sp. TaxID=259303 RepID=UPI0034574E0B
MSKPKDMDDNENYKLKDADNNDGLVPDDALQKVNPAAAEEATEDHDPHDVAKSVKQYDSNVTEHKK